jgi:hypothetical protein
MRKVTRKEAELAGFAEDEAQTVPLPKHVKKVHKDALTELPGKAGKDVAAWIKEGQRVHAWTGRLKSHGKERIIVAHGAAQGTGAAFASYVEYSKKGAFVTDHKSAPLWDDTDE